MAEKPLLTNRVIFGLVVIHLAITLPLALSLNIWSDEGSSLYTTRSGFWEAFRNAAVFEKQAPLYFWLLSLWRMANDSIFFSRLFSILCSCVAIILFAQFARSRLPARSALLATAFFSLHPFLIWTSLEIRVYALVVLLSVLMLRLFFLAFVDAEALPRRKQLTFGAAFAGVSIVALYTNYYLGFLLPGLFLALLATKRFRQSLEFIGFMMIVLLAITPLASSVIAQLDVNTGGYQEPRTLYDGLRGVWHSVISFILPLDLYADGSGGILLSLRLWLLRIGMVVVAIFAFIRRDRVSQQTRVLAIVATGVVAWLLVAYFILGSDYIALRHNAVLFAIVILFVASLLSDVVGDLSSAKVKGASLAFGLLVLGAFSYSLIKLYPNNAKRGDWARIGAFITQHEAPNQPIMIFPVYDALSLPYHYRGVNRVLPNERFIDFDTAEAQFGTPESTTSETEYFISQIPPEPQYIWLALGEKCLISQACVRLENFIRANYTIELEKDFYLEKLYLLKKRV